MIKCPGCARRRELLRRVFSPKQKEKPLAKPAEPKPIGEADVVFRRDRSGDNIAFDIRNNRILASDFDDESDFEDWREKYFANLKK